MNLGTQMQVRMWSYPSMQTVTLISPDCQKVGFNVFPITVPVFTQPHNFSAHITDADYISFWIVFWYSLTYEIMMHYLWLIGALFCLQALYWWGLNLSRMEGMTSGVQSFAAGNQAYCGKIFREDVEVSQSLLVDIVITLHITSWTLRQPNETKRRHLLGVLVHWLLVDWKSTPVKTHFTLCLNAAWSQSCCDIRL